MDDWENTEIAYSSIHSPTHPPTYLPTYLYGKKKTGGTRQSHPRLRTWCCFAQRPWLTSTTWRDRGCCRRRRGGRSRRGYGLFLGSWVRGGLWAGESGWVWGVDGATHTKRGERRPMRKLVFFSFDAAHCSPPFPLPLRSASARGSRSAASRWGVGCPVRGCGGCGGGGVCSLWGGGGGEVGRWKA